MNVRWWCSAQPGSAWTWEPQAYPGIWLFVALVAVAYLLLLRSTPSSPGGGQRAAFAGGLALLWLTLDWPLGALAAGYLLTAHMLQYVLLSLVVAPALLAGVPAPLRVRALGAPTMAPVRWLVRRPIAAFGLFNAVLVVTHIPLVADTLKPLQLGSMAMDVVWLGTALLFWWSLTSDGEEAGPEAIYGRRMLFLLGTKILPIAIGALFVFSEFPIYATYELAARAVEGLGAKGDQTIAGWLMWMGATPLLVMHLAVTFFTWHELEARGAAGPA